MSSGSEEPRMTADGERDLAQHTCWIIDRDPWEIPHFDTEDEAEEERAAAVAVDGVEDGPVVHLPEPCQILVCKGCGAEVHSMRRSGRGDPEPCGETDLCGEWTPRIDVSVGDYANGYPCPKDGATMTLLSGGAWCPKCKTVWRQVGEIDV